LRFFISNGSDVKYLEALIKTGDGEARKCTVTAVDNADQFAFSLTINPAAKRRVWVVQSGLGLKPGVSLDLFGARAQISLCADLNDGYELEFSDRQPIPERFLKRVRQLAAPMLLQTA
jgi:hypothetical protein